MAILKLFYVCFIGIVYYTRHCVAKKQFRGAVYAHALVLPDFRNQTVSRQYALDSMQKNMIIFEEQTKIAKLKGADIIVFPEDGLYGFGYASREALYPYLEMIPDPKKTSWNPCMEGPAEDIMVQRNLSCMARNNNIYVVANMGDAQDCKGKPKCPPDGRWQFNTDVVFDSNGTLVARYHKENLFLFETRAFDTPSKVEKIDFITFDTMFGRFGVFTCFDVLFKEPAISLVEKYDVDTIVFPTAWMNMLPLFSAVEFHSAWAMGMGVNYLAANIQLPQIRMTGSGVYSATGARDYMFNESVPATGQLLITDLDVNPKRKPFKEVKNSPSNEIKSSEYKSSEVFKSQLFGDMFNFKQISKEEEINTVCHNKLCCKAKYYISANPSMASDELYALGAFDGLHTLEGQYYLQICVLLKCANLSHSSCGQPTTQANTKFTNLTLTGTHSTQYIFPEVLLTNNQLSMNEFEFTPEKELLARSGFSQPLLTAALFGRDYDRDTEYNNPLTSGTTNCAFGCMSFGFLVVLTTFVVIGLNIGIESLVNNATITDNIVCK